MSQPAARLLVACLKEKPDDIALLNQRAATLLRESQAKSTQKKAAAIYEKITALEADEKNKIEKDDRALLARNRVLFLAISGHGKQALAELAAALNDHLLDDKAGEELRPLLE